MKNLPTSIPKKRPRPGVIMRGAMTHAYAQRGKRQGKLWLQYSNKARQDVAFATELGYAHFLFVESSPDVTGVDYTPAATVTRAVGESFADYIHAEIVLANGDVVWRHICSQDRLEAGKQTAAQLGVLLQTISMPGNSRTPRLETLTDKEIFVSEQRIRNWHRIATWLAAARDFELHDYELEVASLMHDRGRVEFQQVLALGKNTEQSFLFGAALFKQLQRGAYQSNLFEVPFSMRSVFSEKRGAA